MRIEPVSYTHLDVYKRQNSIFALVAEHSGRTPLKSDPCTVEIALADAQAASLLEVPVGEPLFYMEADVYKRQILAIFGFMFGWDNAAYSIVFQFISTKTIDSFYRRYDRVTLQITTRKADEVMTRCV